MCRARAFYRCQSYLRRNFHLATLECHVRAFYRLRIHPRKHLHSLSCMCLCRAFYRLKRRPRKLNFMTYVCHDRYWRRSKSFQNTRPNFDTPLRLFHNVHHYSILLRNKYHRRIDNNHIHADHFCYWSHRSTLNHFHLWLFGKPLFPQSKVSFVPHNFYSVLILLLKMFYHLLLYLIADFK